MDFSFYFSIYCIIHLWAAVLMLLLVRSNTTSNRLFAFFLFLFSNIHIAHLALQTGLIFQYPWMYYDPLCGILLCAIPVVFYFYVQSMTGEWKLNSGKNYFHFIVLVPAAIHFVYLLIFKSPEDLKEYYYKEDLEFTLANSLLLFGMISIFIFYLYKSMRLIRNYDRALKENFSTTEKIKITWLLQLIYVLLILTIVLCPVLIITGQQDLVRIGLGLYTSIVFFLIVYKSIRYEKPVITIPVEKIMKASKERNFSISENEYDEQCFNAIIDFLKTNKSYLKPDFSMADLSNETKISVHQLSRVINSKSGGSFFDLINSFRIEEVKAKLNNCSYNHFSIEGIGFDSGFGSKAAFYKVFKNNTGKTPAEYRTIDRKPVAI